MQFPSLHRYYTGLSVPVSSLRSETSAGTGEFYDLILLGSLCRECGIDLIQLLPVQDTGYQSSPYSTLSAYALHPLYIRLSELPEADSEEITEKIRSFTAENRNVKHLRYEQVLKGKLGVLKLMYEGKKEKILKDRKISGWVGENPWVKTYAVFNSLKDRFDRRSWREWPEMRDPEPEDIENFWNDSENRDELGFHVWLQFRLDEQFSHVSKTLNGMGVLLKGDIPILMNDDSADVWSRRDFFNLAFQAGAPPDYYSATGQNWGFPTYNWENLEKSDYSWWKARLKQGSRYYSAFRIDHVLGFFRIWSIPAADITGYLGHFEPAGGLTNEDLEEIGFNEGRRRWLAEPHISSERLWGILGEEASKAIALCFDRIGNEELFLFKPEIAGEKTIYMQDLSDHAKETLAAFFRDRSLVKISEGVYFPIWTYHDTSAYRSLSEDERNRLDSLIERSKQDSERIWEENGRKLLQFMKDETTMLPCAEDLGAVPESVPVVLDDLEILSLKIPRWTRDYKKEGAPMIGITQYPFLSVCTPSVHDTTTMREWWLSEDGKADFWKSLGFKSECPAGYSPEVARKIVKKLLGTSSCMCIFQIQELFAMQSDLREQNPEDTRINIPGTISDKNWSYRITPTLEHLLEDGNLIVLLRSWTEERREREVRTIHSGKVKAGSKGAYGKLK